MIEYIYDEPTTYCIKELESALKSIGMKYKLMIESRYHWLRNSDGDFPTLHQEYLAETECYTNMLKEIYSRAVPIKIIVKKEI